MYDNLKIYDFLKHNTRYDMMTIVINNNKGDNVKKRLTTRSLKKNKS